MGGEISEVSTDDLFKGKKVVLVGYVYSSMLLHRDLLVGIYGFS